MQRDSDIPLCVDLDGTLIKSDTLFESALKLLKTNPLHVFQMLLWFRRGKAVLKKEIAARVTLDPLMFPYNEEIIEFVRDEKTLRETVLITGSDQSAADFVAQDTQLFDRALGSDGETNLTAENKRDWLVKEFGAGGFDYIGNDADDIAVWADSRKALLAADNSIPSIFSGIHFHRVFDVPKAGVKDFFKLIRMHQWSKNFLVFIPFLLDKTVQSWSNLVVIIVCFLAMSVLASMTYIVNDMVDLTADRNNESKKTRMLASCRVPLKIGATVAFVLLVIFCILSFMLPIEFFGIMMFYLVTTLAYTFYLKAKMILDVCTIAVLHTVRIVAGVVAVNAIWSFWLLAFSMFVFFSISVAKRVSELKNMPESIDKPANSRGYVTSDISMLSSIGVSTGYISVLVVALFIQSDKVAVNYSEPMMLWLLCPLLMYWIGRLWLIAARGFLDEDPIVFAAKDRVSIAVVIALALVVAAASLL